jgi:hypothetical protein
MNQKIKIIIGVAIILLVFGCTAEEETGSIGQEEVENNIQMTASAQELKKLVDLERKRPQTAEIKTDLTTEGEQVILTLTIYNPNNYQLVSARSWLAYNPDQLAVTQIDTTTSAFDLTAPYEHDIDPILGLIKIGLSKTGGSITGENAEIAKVIFKKIGSGVSMIEFYDFGQEIDSHTQINAIFEEEQYPVNVMKKQPEVVVVGESP